MQTMSTTLVHYFFFHHLNLLPQTILNVFIIFARRLDPLNPSMAIRVDLDEKGHIAADNLRHVLRLFLENRAVIYSLCKEFLC
jgi:hypothetical protein